MKLLWVILFSLFLSTPVRAGNDDNEGERFRFFDPFQTTQNLPCAQEIFFVFLGNVLNQIVVGDGPVTLLTMQAANAVGTEQNDNEILYDFALQVEKLRALNLQTAPFKRAWERMTHNEKPHRLVICLLSEGCVVTKERGAVYLQFSVDPDEVMQTKKKKATGGAGKKSAAPKSKGPRKASRMKVEPRSKRGKPVEEEVEPVDWEPVETDGQVEEIVIETATLPRLLVVNHSKNSSGVFPEAELLTSVVRGIVRYNEDIRFDHWLHKNRALTAGKRDHLFKAVKNNLVVFNRMMMAAMSMQVELEISGRYLNSDKMRELDEQARKFVMLQYKDLDVDLAGLVESEINEKNILELFETLAGTYFTGP